MTDFDLAMQILQGFCLCVAIAAFGSAIRRVL
jgi:hypothetical protein